MKRLYRSKDNRIIAGVFGGLGEFFDIDPTILRLVGIIVLIFTGFVPGILVYIIAFLVMPARALRVVDVEPEAQREQPADEHRGESREHKDGGV